MRIKFGGSGDTSIKNLESYIDKIIRARAANVPISIDSNLVICLIREILEGREVLHVSEFCLTEVEAVEKIEEKKVKLRVPKKKRELPSKQYWLDSWEKRVVAGTVCIIVTIISCVFIASFF